MILIHISTEYRQAARSAIETQYRLHELISTASPDDADLLIDADGNIQWRPVWKRDQLPLLLPPVAFTENSWLGYLYARLGNYESARQHLGGYDALLRELYWFEYLMQNTVEQVQADHACRYESLHNQAVAGHYCHHASTGEWFKEALQAAPGLLYKAFTTCQAVQYLGDLGEEKEALSLLQPMLSETLPEAARFTLLSLQCQLQVASLEVPYDKDDMQAVKQSLWTCLEYYEKSNSPTDIALLLQDAAYIAGIENSFSEALGYINRALEIWQSAEMPELSAEVWLRKGNLLKNWAQTGQSQFFRPAMEAYQEALKTFTRETAPSIFSTIQHQLGIVYSEVPDEVKKKSVWAAVSVSAFQEALSFFNKIDFPYQFGVICNDLGNAYTRYPVSVHTDNFDKALSWYREALDVQPASTNPLERVMTLMNYLDASWFAANKEAFDEVRFNDMRQKAAEVIAISIDPSVKSAAQRHLERLDILKAGFES